MNIIGTEGNGYYSVAFSIYSVALMLTSYSLPLAVSKLVSARVAVGEYKNANKIFRGAMTFALLAGGIVSLLVFFGADFIATTIMHLDMSAYALRVLAPCILIVALLGVLRGFFQGNGIYDPDSNLTGDRADCKCCYIDRRCIFIIQCRKSCRKDQRRQILRSCLCGSRRNTRNSPWCIERLDICRIHFSRIPQSIQKKMKRDHSGKRESYRTVYKVLFVTIAPVILSATVYNISDFVDTALFNNVMAAQGFSKKRIRKSSWNLSGTVQYNDQCAALYLKCTCRLTGAESGCHCTDR